MQCTVSAAGLKTVFHDRFRSKLALGGFCVHECVWVFCLCFAALNHSWWRNCDIITGRPEARLWINVNLHTWWRTSSLMVDHSHPTRHSLVPWASNWARSYWFLFSSLETPFPPLSRYLSSYWRWYLPSNTSHLFSLCAHIIYYLSLYSAFLKKILCVVKGLNWINPNILISSKISLILLFFFSIIQRITGKLNKNTSLEKLQQKEM